jgi:ABC-type transporter Mla subunit MlaD
MSQKANYFRLGVFILAAVAIFIALVLALTAGQLLKGTVTMETYFNESVQGLDIGSQVKYRGVQVGRVTQIGFSAPKYQRDVPWSERKQYVLVEAELDRAVIGTQDAPDPDRLNNAVERGLRVRLAPVGITGAAYLEIDILDPKLNRPLEIGWKPDYAYIPSAPSTYNQIVRGAQRVFAQLDDADIDGVIRDIAALARTANYKLSELQLGELSKDLASTMREARTLVARLDKLITSPELTGTLRDLSASSTRLREVLASPDWTAAPTKAVQAFETVRALAENKNLHDALTNLDRTLARLDALTAGSDTDVATALYNLRRATENLRDLSENAKRYPGSIFSEPPRPVTLPSK